MVNFKPNFSQILRLLGVYRFPVYWLWAMAAVILGVTFGEVLIAANQYMFASSGDALNIYYSSSYFIKYIPEGVHHTGASYPYGNHLVYDDVNPLLSLLLRFVVRLFPIVGDYTVGIINLSILLSFFPAVTFMYWILRKILLPLPYAMICSLVIVFLSPQVERFTGHLTLSYVCYVPMVWYMILLIFENKRMEWPLVGFVSLVSIFSFIHPYYFLIGTGFLYSYLLVYLLQHWEKLRIKGFQLWKEVFIIGFAGVLPGIILKGWEILTQVGATDFVEYPYGFLLFTSSFRQIFFSSHDPLYSFWDVVFHIKPNPWEEWLKWEGVAYVGVVGFVVLLAIVVRVIALMIQKRFRQIAVPVMPDPLKTGIWATTLLLIWAMGYPFKPFPELLDWVGFLRQFRSQGRLSWPFYYVYMSLSVYLIYAFVRTLRLRWKPGSQRRGFWHIWVLLGIAAWSISRWVDLLGPWGYSIVVIGTSWILITTYFASPKMRRNTPLAIGFLILSIVLCVFWGITFQYVPPVWLKYFLPIWTLLLLLFVIHRAKKNVFEIEGSKWVGVGLIVLSLGLWAWEARSMLKNKRDFILTQRIETAYPEWQVDFDSVLADHGYQSSDFQAILSFPFYHFGTQKFTLESFHSTRHANAVSFQTGLPMFNTLVARAPISPSLSLLQLVSEPSIRKSILTDLPDDRPILLLYSHEPLAEVEQAYVAAADSITQVHNIRFARLMIDSIPFAGSQMYGQYEARMDSAILMRTEEGYDVPKKSTLDGFLWEAYGDDVMPLGDSVYHIESRKDTFFRKALVPVNTVDSLAEGWYECSFWAKVDTRSHFLPAIIYEQWDGNIMVDQKPLELKISTDVYKDWIRTDFTFNLQKASNVIMLYTWAEADMLTLDNLMIRPVALPVYADRDSVLWYNNMVVEQ